MRHALAIALILQLVLAPAHTALAADEVGSSRTARGSDVNASQAAASFTVGADPSTGAATLVYPIRVAPGTNGVQPEVALRYTSASRANGWVGKGWSLDLGSIELSHKRGVPRYDGTDPVTLDGEELVTDPTTGLPQTRHHSFARIRHFGPAWAVECVQRSIVNT